MNTMFFCKGHRWKVRLLASLWFVSERKHASLPDQLIEKLTDFELRREEYSTRSCLR